MISQEYRDYLVYKVLAAYNDAGARAPVSYQDSLRGAEVRAPSTPARTSVSRVVTWAVEGFEAEKQQDVTDEHFQDPKNKDALVAQFQKIADNPKRVPSNRIAGKYIALLNSGAHIPASKL